MLPEVTVAGALSLALGFLLIALFEGFADMRRAYVYIVQNRKSMEDLIDGALIDELMDVNDDQLTKH